MSKNNLGYTWYPKDWALSTKVFKMSLEMRGFYREMIDFAYQNDNNFAVEIEYFCRMFGISKRKFNQLLTDLIALKLIEKHGDNYSIPSVEPRIQLIRSGRKGGKTSKPIPKQNAKQNSNQKEKEKEKEKERERERENHRSFIDDINELKNMPG